MIELKGTFSPVKVLKGNINAVSVGLASGMIPVPSTAEVGQILSVLAVDDEKKLTAVEAIDKPETPLFDLTSAGLPAITPDGVPVELETDTTEILAAVSKGAVVFKLNAELGGEVIPANIVGTCICSNIGEETASVICPFVMDELGFVLLSVYPQRIEAVYMPHSMIAGSGGVSSWNDLTDKPFGEEGGEVEIFPEQELTFTGSSGTYTLESAPALFVLVEGETYRVVLDGTEHELVCALDYYGALVLSHYVLNESGEPTDGTFVIMYGSAEVTGTEGGATAVSVFDSSNTATHTLGIYQNGTTIKTLDAKFLPMDAIDARIDAKLAEMPDVSEVGM